MTFQEFEKIVGKALIIRIDGITQEVALETNERLFRLLKYKCKNITIPINNMKKGCCWNSGPASYYVLDVSCLSNSSTLSHNNDE
jgi:hypothetical protein